MEQDFPMGAGHSDILTDISPSAAPTAPIWMKRPMTNFASLHPMQWAPRPAALFLGEDLDMQDQGHDEEASGQG